VTKAALAFLILVLALAGPAAATELDDAIAAAHRGDYATALRGLSPLTEGVTRAPISTSDSCTPRDGAWRRILPRPSNGIAKLRTRDFRSHSIFLGWPM
jgi:hypothetical protein